MVLERLNTSIARMCIASLDGNRSRDEDREEMKVLESTKNLKRSFHFNGEFILTDCRFAELCSKLERLNPWIFTNWNSSSLCWKHRA